MDTKTKHQELETVHNQIVALQIQETELGFELIKLEEEEAKREFEKRN